MDNIVIVSAVRTPVGNLNGVFSSLQAHDLGSIAIKEALRRGGLAGSDVSEVIFGHVLSAGQGQNPVRQASVAAGVPFTVPATSVNMLCGSGLRSVVMAAQALLNGDGKVIVAGGQESMTNAPHCVRMRAGLKFGDVPLVDTLVMDGLTDAFVGCHMGMTAENVASQWSVERSEQDEFALLSQRKCEIARNAGKFAEEIVSVVLQSRSGEQTINRDEFPKDNCSIENLQCLKPAFLRDGSGTVTAGNSSGINDGAAAVVLMTGAEAAKRNLPPLGRIVSWAQAGVDPSIMGTGPIPAVRAALLKAAWTVQDVDLFELNEAFAAQSLAVIKELNCDANKVNVNGGAIALGHPIGASGCRILVTLLYAMKSTDARRGVAALCVGGGMGIAVCVEVV